MALSTVQTLSAVCAVIVSLLFIRSRLKRGSIAYIRGPSNPSWFLGHQRIMRRQLEVGELESQWFGGYGNTLRISGCYSEQILYTCDPKALQYIYQTTGYGFAKPGDVLRIMEESFGRGLIWAEGPVNHGRQRKVMLPAFSVPQLRAFQDVFRLWASRLAQKWKEEIQNGREIINTSAWVGKLTLDIIGESAFEYKFDALDGGSSELWNAAQNMFATAGPPTDVDILYRTLWRFLPGPILKVLEFIPTQEAKRFRIFLDVANKVARSILDEKETQEAMEDTSNKDVLSTLIRGNLAEDPAKRLSDGEVSAQLATLMFAGHDTTASTMTWMLWELSKHPEYQKKIRDEISAVRTKNLQEGKGEFTSLDYDSMVYFNAALKETLRFHPIIPQLVRQARRDGIVPLSDPIVTKDGKVISEIPIVKGQSILASISTYNRLTSVWGDDAEIWNPDRFLSGNQEKQVSVGMTSNLMTFGAGLKGCIGWRFAMMEIQAVLVNLLGSFEFSLPEESIHIHRAGLGLMMPLVKGKLKDGVQMPLRVSIVDDN